MTEKKRVQPAAPGPSARLLPGLLFLFVGSGCAALIYEVVWFQLLQLVVGASALSLGVLLAAFMGGLCAGSLLLPRLVSPGHHPLRVYAYLELGIGALGLLILVAVPWLGGLYVAYAGTGTTGLLLRAALAGLCLVPPTLLMGATLPAIGRWVDTTPEGMSWLGFFYGGNIAGAVAGCLLAGFYLLRLFDVTTATVVAAALNVTVAGVALVMAGRVPHTPAPGGSAGLSTRTASPGGGALWPAYLAIGLSGFTALGAEVLWTRVLGLMFGGTVYSFSIILAVFLTGLGLGSGGGAWFARTSARPGVALAWCQIGVVAGIAWAAMLMHGAFPQWPIDPSLGGGPWYNFQLDVVRSALAILPAAICWGASFPLALAAIAPSARDAGRVTGTVYAANTIGAIAGALLVSVVGIPTLGTQHTLRGLAGLAAAAALLMLQTSPWMASRRRGASLAAVVAGAVAVATITPVPPLLIGYGRQTAAPASRQARFLFAGEGRTSSVAVSELPGGVRNFHVAGKVEASTEIHDMRLQRLLGHMSGLMHEGPKSVLIVGFGAGVTAGAFLVHPSVTRVVICEIEPLVPEVVSRFFTTENHDLVNDPRVEIVYDDARHFILTTGERFDVITSDPIHPWVKGAASLYSKEYFELVKQHLNPGGVVTQWVPLYESTPEVIKSEFATFFDTFPNGTVWSNEYADGRGYDVVLLAKAGPMRINPGALQERLDRPDHATIAAELAQVSITGVLGLLTTYGGRAQDLAPWLAGADVNRDASLRLQYLAGLGNNAYDDGIWDAIRSYMRFPEDMFDASDDLKNGLRQVFAQRGQPAGSLPTAPDEPPAR